MGGLRLALAIKKSNDTNVRNLLKLNTYNAKRQQKYGNRYFIGCEDMIVKRLRNECKISTDDFTDDELMSLIGLFEMYGNRYFIGCEEMIVKRLRNECKISTDD